MVKPGTRVCAGLFAAMFGMPVLGTDVARTPLNPVAGFDVSLNGWDVVTSAGGLVQWAPDDASANPLSGAALFTGPAGQYELRSCFPAPDPSWPAFYYTATGSTRTIGAAARVRAVVTVGFTGDAPGDPADCPGPWTHDATPFNVLVEPSTAFVSQTSSPRRASNAPWVSIAVVVDKPDASDVLVDDVQVFVTDQLFLDGF